MSRVQTVLLIGIAFAFAACGSTGKTQGYVSSSGPTQITFRDHRTGQELTLINESHSDPVEYYSQARRDANTKVSEDEVVDALIDYFVSEGYEGMKLAGPPPMGGGGASRSIEVQRGGRSEHIHFLKGEPRRNLEAFNACFNAFVGIYQNTYGAQSVDGGTGIAFQPLKKRN